MVLTRINNNVSAINANRNLNQVSFALARSLERLSSGLRINRAADDAAGLSISERQRSQIRGLNRAVANAQDAIGLINTAEGALNETTNRLQRIRELAIQALNTGGSDAEAVQAAQDEIETAIQEITRIGDTTQFSTRILLNGDNESRAAIRAGTPSRGVSIANTTLASSLPSGTSFLRLTQTQVGTEFITVGSDGVGNFRLHTSGDVITNNTFGTGQYQITVSNVTAQARQVIRTADSQRFAGTANIALTHQLLTASFGGISIDAGDRIILRGTRADGTVVTTTLTAGNTFAQLLAALNGPSMFSGVAAAVFSGIGSANVALRLSALNFGDSQLALEILIDDASASGGTADGVADASVRLDTITLGSFNSAILTIDGGPAVTAVASPTGPTSVTLYGREPSTPTNTDFQRQVTLTFAASTVAAPTFVREGVELLNVVENRYTASLNGGQAVEFAPGQKEVLLRSGTGAGFSSGDFLLLNIAAALDLSGTPAVGLQATVILSATNKGLNFQIGANQGQKLLVGLSDLRANKLGFRDGLEVNGVSYDGTVDRLDVRTVQGAENAVRIVDRALAQVSRQRSFLGATTNRLEATIANLGVASENLTAAESRIRDADIAFETTQFTRNQIMVQAGTAILAQANLAPQSVLQLIG